MMEKPREATGQRPMLVKPPGGELLVRKGFVARKEYDGFHRAPFG